MDSMDHINKMTGAYQCRFTLSTLYSFFSSVPAPPAPLSFSFSTSL